MTVQADTHYLPVLRLPRIDVLGDAVARHKANSRQKWGPRIYRVSDKRSIDENSTYTNCGAKTFEPVIGRIIDVYA